ncbi:hypothetical protein BAE44_0024317 [Dichanthelium oligosanthes]|uniref:Neprosin PEP catalytic domain-containing protein n=1 Tax=Dichanthelium oligosanthes TaxID=888268 RepID=A0A1E5UP79_9POAL|nr:hypothetical protein BAE44_0024317 [Dichanthelium oligosanthes]
MFTLLSIICVLYNVFSSGLQADGFDGKTGCIDLGCNGFVQKNCAPITPGDTLELVNGQAKISLKIFKVHSYYTLSMRNPSRPLDHQKLIYLESTLDSVRTIPAEHNSDSTENHPDSKVVSNDNAFVEPEAQPKVTPSTSIVQKHQDEVAEVLGLPEGLGLFFATTSKGEIIYCTSSEYYSGSRLVNVIIDGLPYHEGRPLDNSTQLQDPTSSSSSSHLSGEVFMATGDLVEGHHNPIVQSIREKSWLAKFKPANIDKFNGKQNPEQWLHLYSTAVQAAGGNNDDKVNYFPVALSDSPLQWLQQLPKNSIDSWDTLTKLFMSTFHGNWAKPPGLTELKTCKQKQNETIRSYNRRFFEARSTMINLTDKENKDDGDWWLHFGKDINNLHPVGFWPKKLFNKMEDHANKITWGGYARCYGVNPSPPMGNGQWPGKSSASIQDIQFVDTSGQGYAVPAWALKGYSNKKECYQASPFMNNMFYYGGPGGCRN